MAQTAPIPRATAIFNLTDASNKSAIPPKAVSRPSNE